jgi:gliding motility-associated lipoprotein GldH
MVNGRNRLSFLIIFTAVISATACSDGVVFNEAQDMPGKTWGLSNVPVFSVPVDDTLHSNNISFSIRTGSSYPFRNIYLFVTTISPRGAVLTDTLQYNLADEKGRRYGKGFGDIRELTLPFRLNVYFPAKGTYTVKVQHGMRLQDLKGVYDFGMRVDRISK